MAAGTLVQVAADAWVAASVGAADSVAVAATAEALAATTVDTAAELTEAVITAARIQAVMQVEVGSAERILAEAPHLRDRGRGKAAKAQRGILPRVGMDSPVITAP